MGDEDWKQAVEDHAERVAEAERETLKWKSLVYRTVTLARTVSIAVIALGGVEAAVELVKPTPFWYAIPYIVFIGTGAWVWYATYRIRKELRAI